ncbi:MAG TPA: hypothetical protein EYG12_05245 [Gammaproteobacteria bacterium]|nr:hypothetical protein [Gammaproteobacteria bacterium]
MVWFGAGSAYRVRGPRLDTSGEALMSGLAGEGKSHRGRWALIALVAVFIAPVLVAFFWQPTGYVNRGQLIEPPRLVSDLAMHMINGRATALSSLKGKWTYVYFSHEVCDQTCNAVIESLVRIRLSRGKHKHRIQFLVAIVSPSAPPSDERVSHSAVRTAYIEKSALGRWRKAFGVEDSAPPEAGRIYLLDPLGYLMMSYPLAIDPNDIRKDLARLMRVSRVG